MVLLRDCGGLNFWVPEPFIERSTEQRYRRCAAAPTNERRNGDGLRRVGYALTLREWQRKTLRPAAGLPPGANPVGAFYRQDIERRQAHRPSRRAVNHLRAGHLRAGSRLLRLEPRHQHADLQVTDMPEMVQPKPPGAVDQQQAGRAAQAIGLHRPRDPAAWALKIWNLVGISLNGHI